jgi:antitoxin component HigA of HigAB toxin-antitoxin module
MKSATRSKRAVVMPRAFAELNVMHPLRPINDDLDLRNSEEVMDRLAVLSRRTRDQDDYLQTPVLLCEAYERQQIEDAMDPSKSSSNDALKYLMQAQNMKQADLAKLLKLGASAVSMILSGDRPITADHARALAKHFRLSPAAFL